jgi:ubiquinone/menaquinone biosynthesis C-methylase UbiE
METNKENNVLSDSREFLAHEVDSYDAQWLRLTDFIEYNPGSRHRRRIISQLLKPYQNEKLSVIDAGCGLGFTVLEISKSMKFSEITGVDFSRVAIEGAKRKFPEFKWQQVDLLSETANLNADILVCTEVIEHVENYRILLNNLVNILQPGGLLLLTTQSGKVHETEVQVGHVRHFKIDEMIYELEQKGLDVIHQQLWGWPGYVCLKYLINLNPSQAIEKFGNGEYNAFAKVLNNIVYFLTKWLSLPNTKKGSQIVLLARKK